MLFTVNSFFHHTTSSKVRGLDILCDSCHIHLIYINVISREMVHIKGQIILKGLFGILQFFQKMNEQIRFSFVHFLEESEDTKKKI